MKKVIAIFLAAVLLLSLAACQASKPDYEEPGFQALNIDSKDSYSDYPGVYVQVDDIYLGDGKINLVVVWSNDTKYDAIYGASYVIERYEDGEWVDCAKVDELSFIAIAYELTAGRNRNESYNLTDMYDISKAGEYRFRTTCSVRTGSDDANNITLWAEFTVRNIKCPDDSKETGTEAQYSAQYYDLC